MAKVPVKVRVKQQVLKKSYALYCGDCCEVIRGIPEASVGLSVFSPPFADLYSYSDAIADMGNCRGYKDFFAHFRFLAEELLRILLPGRVVAVHCMDLPTFKRSGEEMGLQDFPGDIVDLFRDVGFIPHSHHCIWKDPLIAATRTKALGLAHKQICKDSSLCRMGTADYVWAFRKPGVNPEPIRHPVGLTEYCGEKPVPRDFDRFLGWEEPKTNKRSHWIWQRYASPVWDDIRQTRVLPHRVAKDPDDEKHICPLQLDVIERCVVLWSNPGDVVFTPFMGVGSEVYVAAKLGRKGVGVELKPRYFRIAERNLRGLTTKGKGFKGDNHE